MNKLKVLYWSQQTILQTCFFKKCIYLIELHRGQDPGASSRSPVWVVGTQTVGPFSVAT